MRTWMLPLECDACRVEFNNVVDVQHGHKLLFKFSERFRLISVKFVRVVDDHFVHLLALHSSFTRIYTSLMVDGYENAINIQQFSVMHFMDEG